MNGILAVSRAFGDRNIKSFISAEPEVRERLLEYGDDFLVLATDGLWDVMTNQEACNVVYSAPDLGPQVGRGRRRSTGLWERFRPCARA